MLIRFNFQFISDKIKIEYVQEGGEEIIFEIDDDDGEMSDEDEPGLIKNYEDPIAVPIPSCLVKTSIEERNTNGAVRNFFKNFVDC